MSRHLNPLPHRRQHIAPRTSFANSDIFVVDDTSNNDTNAVSSSHAAYYTGLDGVHLDLDSILVLAMWMSILIVLTTVLGLRLWQLLSLHLRHIYCLTANGEQQKYWSFDKSRFWPWLKREVIYAPLGKKRHNREIRLSGAMNNGTVPGRLHTVLLVSYVLSNTVYCCLLDYGNPSKGAVFAELRGRSGVLATVNLVPLVVFAGRNNPAISLLQVSFDTFNLFHRWIGRLVVIESTIHVLAWYAASALAKGAGATSKSFVGDPFLQYGLVAMLAMAVILCQSVSAIRHAFYETFLHLHQILAFVALLGVSFHLEIAQLPSVPYIRAAIGLWIGERAVRLLRILYLNHSRRGGMTSVAIEALPGEACRLTFQLPRHVRIPPGSHIYAYLPRVALWMSHPFSVAWTNIESAPPTGHSIEDFRPRTPNSLEKQKVNPTFDHSKAPTSVSLIVVARTGMTRKIYQRALAAPGRTIHMYGCLEGPYAGHDSLASYGTVIMFAGGAGITHHLIQIRHLLACVQANTVATRRITLIWSVRDVDALTWVQPWMDEILIMERGRDVLKMNLYVTRPRGTADYRSPNATIQLYQGRVDPEVVLDEELPARVGATMVSICGPGAFADEVRAAVRSRIHIGCIDMVEESFTW